ncbi:PIN domain-containing protein [Rhizobium sp. TH2]|uniref:PIN domain-containing protein n=1 Tax=Rhizobium sp. TH2 TaxID=2775403 RepID=UPI002156FEDF|nr:PIN domain-containing protein [Rhizobium sp. TH2]UVC09382.1 PIN domain-containing protein [Rhizobium sp. TH2]
MIVLDTNIVSETSRRLPDAALVYWLSIQRTEELYLTDMTITELFYGGEKHRLKHGSSRYLDNAREILEIRYATRILRSSNASSALAGLVRARREMNGRMMTIQDAQIAAICLSHGATLATRNTKDFEGLDLSLVNPFEGA